MTPLRAAKWRLPPPAARLASTFFLRFVRYSFLITIGADVTEPITKMSIAVPAGEEENPTNGMKPSKAPEFLGCDVVDDCDEFVVLEEVVSLLFLVPLELEVVRKPAVEEIDVAD